MWIDEFFELFYSGDIEKIIEACELKNEKMPQFLYKYKSIDEKEHTFDLLENDLLFLSNANNLNDLYEGEFFYDNHKLFHNRFESNIINNFIKRSDLSSEEEEKLQISKKPFLDLIKLAYENDSIVNKDIPFDEFYKSTLEIIFNSLNDVYHDANDFSKENTYLSCFSEKYDLIFVVLLC